MASTAPGPEDRLDSWKEIAAYLKRGVRTVQRWERSSELPVHRLELDRQGSVFAYRQELDAWWASRGQTITKTGEQAPTVSAQPCEAAGLCGSLVAWCSQWVLGLGWRAGSLPPL